ELKKLFAADVFGGRRSGDMHEEARKFFVNYFKQIALVFGAAWNGRKYSIKSASALRAFIRVAPDVVRRLDQEHADRTDFRAIGRVIAPWGRRIGDRAAMTRLFAEWRPDAVVNLAAETHVDRSIDSPRAFIDTNIVGTFELLETVRFYVDGLEPGDQEA